MYFENPMVLRECEVLLCTRNVIWGARTWRTGPGGSGRQAKRPPILTSSAPDFKATRVRNDSLPIPAPCPTPAPPATALCPANTHPWSWKKKTGESKEGPYSVRRKLNHAHVGSGRESHFATGGPHSSAGVVGLSVSWEQGHLRALGSQRSPRPHVHGLRSRGCSARGELPGAGAGASVKDTCPASALESRHRFVRRAHGTDDNDERLVAGANRVLSE